MGSDLLGRRTVNLEFEVRLDIAESLVQHGPALIKVLETAIASATHAISIAEYDDTQEVRNRVRLDRLAEVLRDGRQFHRAYRQRVFQIPAGLLQIGRNAERQNIVSELAAKFGVDRNYFWVAVRQHKKSFRPKLQERRNKHVLDYLIAGLRDKEIAVRIGVTEKSVSRIVRPLREEAKLKKLSLQAFRNSKFRQVRTQKNNPTNTGRPV